MRTIAWSALSVAARVALLGTEPQHGLGKRSAAEVAAVAAGQLRVTGAPSSAKLPKASRADAEEEEEEKCHACGHMNEADSDECEECGARLDSEDEEEDEEKAHVAPEKRARSRATSGKSLLAEVASLREDLAVVANARRVVPTLSAEAKASITDALSYVPKAQRKAFRLKLEAAHLAASVPASSGRGGVSETAAEAIREAMLAFKHLPKAKLEQIRADLVRAHTGTGAAR